MAAATFKGLHVDKCFLATAGISADMQLTYPSLSDLVVKSAMIRAANKVYLLADSSKIGVSSFASLGRISLIDTLITDSKITKEQRQALLELHIDVL
jgi:DeoR/GlpR family transcriptional regulator of sugar metabolism